ILPIGIVLSFWLAERPLPREPGPPPPIPAPPAPRAPNPPKPEGKERLAGRVIGLHAEGLAGLMVSASREGADDVPAETSTLPDGTFVLAGLAPGPFRVRVSGAGVVASEVRRVAAPAANLAVVVSRAVTIAGSVTDAGIPAAGAAIEVSGATLDAPPEVAAGPDGRFRVDGLPEGQFVVAARRGGRAAADINVGRRGLGPWPDVALALAPAAS